MKYLLIMYYNLLNMYYNLLTMYYKYYYRVF